MVFFKIFGRNKALRKAAIDGNIDVVREMIEKDADVHSKDDNGNTALIIASVEGHIDIVKLLIEKGADVNAQNQNQGTA